jgi:hypothetical protein
MVHMPYFLACRNYNAYYKLCFNVNTSSLEDLEWLTYCIKNLLSGVFQSRGGIILFNTSYGLGFASNFFAACLAFWYY